MPHADREQVIDVLKAAFVQARLFGVPVPRQEPRKGKVSRRAARGDGPASRVQDRTERVRLPRMGNPREPETRAVQVVYVLLDGISEPYVCNHETIAQSEARRRAGVTLNWYEEDGHVRTESGYDIYKCPVHEFAS
jgi:hypothetical protein